MRAARNYVIPVAMLTALWGARAPVHAQPEPALSDEDLGMLAEAEAIEIFDERPDKPFDRDTEVRLTGEQLAARGATDLATALALLPDVTVRDAGRGGFNVDIRGARKGAVSVLIDGVLVSDPYYGTFDVSTIPVTDIVQIRVSTTPQSPIDGPGGPGGVIEVLTRDAFGEQLVIARVHGDSLPTFGITGTARAPLAKYLALRISSSGIMGARDLELPGAGSVGEGKRAATGSARLEYRKRDRRIAIDGFLDDRRYLAPPSDEVVSNFLLIDRETSARASAKADDRIGTLQLQGQYWVHYLHRRSRQFADPALIDQLSKENLFAIRSGGSLLATRPFRKDYRWATSTVIDHEKALVFDQDNNFVRGDTTLIELAASGQYEHKRVRLDAALGFATAFGVGADPWPEGKIAAKYKPRQTLEITATTGYKGRVPSLRERFDAQSGNESLGPEKALHAEVRAVEQRDRIRLEGAPFYRRTTGTIRTSIDPMDAGKLVNLGTVDILGVDLQGRGLVHAMVEVGASYNYVKANSKETGDDPIDRLPAHRADAWARFLPNAAYSALVRVRYFGSSIDRGTVVEGHALVEATVTAQLSKQYLGVLRIEDALDQQPETRLGYHTAGRVISVVFQGSWN